MADEKAYPTEDGAAINPYDLPGQPRPVKDEPRPTPDADETMDVPGPGGEPEGVTTADTTTDDDMDDDKPKRKKG